MSITKHISPILIIVLTIATGCNKNPIHDLDKLMALAETNPDSAISCLQKEEHIQDFSKEDLAKYSLAYTWALDKSGVDVNNDSLLHNAYQYYKTEKNNIWYSRCMYYMGKYYSMVDSTERAENCLSSAANSAKKNKDNKTEYLALEKLSRLMVLHNTQKAEYYANKSIVSFSLLKEKDSTNQVYLLLNAGYCSMQNKHIELAKAKILDALSISYTLNDSSLISASYQDLSVLYSQCQKNDSSLIAARKAYEYATQTNESCKQALIDALLRAPGHVHEAETLVNSLKPTYELGLYTKLYKKHILAIKRGKIQEATVIADSAYSCLESMFSNEIGAKNGYYADILKEEKAKADAENQSKTTGFILFLTIIAAAFLIYVFLMRRKATVQKIQNEREKNKLILAHEKEMHKQETEFLNAKHMQEIANRDIQIGIMRDFLNKKVKIAEKIQSLKEIKDHGSLLNNDDWQEIEIFLNTIDNLFVTRIKEQFPQLQEKDLQLFMLLRLKVPTKNLASIYCITEKAIKQKLFLYKNKVNLDGEKVSLRSFIETF
ncbi:MAG: hypothetical protein HUK06_00440 [Bacteroidaceae bacterium]|nr:hypothetical protein [Bacteroidaceae bacterium]